MTKRILSIVLALLMAINVFTIAAFAEESDNNASWKLVCSNASPQPGDTLEVDVYLEADYVTNTFGALIVYDKNYYEPAETKETDNIVIDDSIADYGNKTVIMSEKKSASIANKLYDASYTDEMKAQYGIAWFSFVFQASKFDDPTSDTIPSYASSTKVATLKLKVKSTAATDGEGLIWMDPVYIQTSNGSAKYTFVARGTSEVIGQCTTAAKFGQTVDVSEAVLYAPQEAPECQHTNTTVINAVAATCTEAGYTGDTYCNDCQQIIQQGSVIPAKGHTEVVDPAVPATCQATGLTAGSHCSVCNTVIVAQQVVPVADHTVVVDPAVPATCQATGLTEGSHCSVCNTVLVAQQIVPLADHTAGEWQVVNPATCTAKGLKAKYCTVCSTLLEQADIEIVDHTVVIDEAVAATCQTTGLTEGSHCSVCNAVIVAQQIVPLADHTWGKWEVVTPATTTQKGLERRECSVCHTTEDRDIPVIVETGADYTAVNAALANVPADLSLYTATTVQALNEAIQAVVYDLPSSQQATVDGYAADIQTAIDNLRLIPTSPASYADLDDYIAKFVPATSNRTNGVYDANELAEIDALIESFDRDLSSSEQATVDGYLTALRVAVAALTIDETKAVATFAISTDKAQASKDDIVTVSLKLKTNYPIYTMQVPVIYDATVFEVVTPNASVPKSYLTYTGSLADAYKLDGNHNPASSMYKRNSNPSYWSTQTQYKVAYATWAYDVSINNIPVTLEDQEVIATFQLKVISDVADTQGAIFLNSDWIKTATTRGGSLAVGRTQGSVISVLEGTKYEIGQTFDLDDAYAAVTVNASHEHVEGAWTIEDGKYVLRCAECQEIMESKDLPLAEIISVENDGTIEIGETTVIKVAADNLVSKVRLVNSAGGGEGSVITTEATATGKVFTMSREFKFTGAERAITVQYKLGNTWLDINTINVNVVNPVVSTAAITAKENVGTVELGAVTKITVATTGTVDKVSLYADNKVDSIRADEITVNNGVFVISKAFKVTGGEKTYYVKYKSDGVWKECGSFTLNVVKPQATPVATVTNMQGTGTIVAGTNTVITVTPDNGTIIEKVRIMNSDGNSVKATTTTQGNSFVLTATFMNGAERTFTVQFKSNGTWYECKNNSFTVKVIKEVVVPTAVIESIEGDGVIVAGTPTVIKVTPTNGTVLEKVRIMNSDGNSVKATVTSDGDALVLTANFLNTVARTFTVQFKAGGTWYDCPDSQFTVQVVKAA